MTTHSRKLQSILALGALLVLAVGCGAPAPSGTTDGNTVETMVAATMQAITQTAASPNDGGRIVSVENVSFTLPAEVAHTGLGGIVPSTIGSEGFPWWEIAPQHVKIALDGYWTGSMLHDPQILVFPASEYAAANEDVARNLEVLATISTNGAGPGTALPSVPFFNAAEVFASQIQAVQFQGGSGVRAVTQYAQAPVSVSNQDIFYLFEGLTQSGAYYIVAIFPLRAPILPEDGGPNTYQPDDGVPFPGYDDPAALEQYYATVTERLNVLTADNFQPSLARLDALIESIVIIED